MDTRRVLNALGGSYRARILPFVPSLSREALWAWSVRGRIPTRHRPAVEKALEAHALEIAQALEEVRSSGSNGFKPTVPNGESR
jgi:hypothetical protein